MARFRLFHEPHYKRIPAEALVEAHARVDVWEVMEGRKGGPAGPEPYRATHEGNW
jgi:hypothetical protein